MVEILNHGNIHRFGCEETFSNRHDDKPMDRSNYNLGISDLPNLESEQSPEQISIGTRTKNTNTKQNT